MISLRTIHLGSYHEEEIKQILLIYTSHHRQQNITKIPLNNSLRFSADAL
jgi:hypothetical protein